MRENYWTEVVNLRLFNGLFRTLVIWVFAMIWYCREHNQEANYAKFSGFFISALMVVGSGTTPPFFSLILRFFLTVD